MLPKNMKPSQMQSIINHKIKLPQVDEFFKILSDNHELWEELVAIGYRKMGTGNGLARRYALANFMRLCNIDKSKLQQIDLYRIERDLI